MRILMSCFCCCCWFVVLFERVLHRPNVGRFLKRNSLMEANMQRKKIDMKHENMKRFLFGFGDLNNTIVLLLNVEDLEIGK